MKGFIPIHKNGKQKHMSHSTMKGPHTISKLKKLGDEGTDKTKNDRNPWNLKEESEDS